MHSEEKARCEEFGEYLVSHGTTVREAARYFGMSKSTVHKDVTETLRFVNQPLWRQVQDRWPEIFSDYPIEVRVKIREMRWGRVWSAKNLEEWEGEGHGK